MRNETRLAFTALAAQIALLNGVASASEKFNVNPSVQQVLEDTLTESVGFLQLINVQGVDEQSGEAIGLGVGRPLAGRTDTSGEGERNAQAVGQLTKDDYFCKQTNFDAAIKYTLLDAWAKFPDFQTRLTAAILKQQALDRIMVGFNGVSAAATTNRTTNPLGQDVNIGWLQKIRTKATDRVIDEGADTGKLTIGVSKVIQIEGVDTEVGGDYQSLDSLVYDMKQMLDPWYRNHPDLVVLVSRDLMHEKLLKAVDKGAKSNVEENAAADIISNARLGGLPVVDAPFFPDGTVLVTFLKNLSLYWQIGARRRHLIDEPKKDQIADYQSSNEAYVIEDFGAVALAENVQEFVYPAPSDAPAPVVEG